MLILGIETSTRQVSCALHSDEGVLASFSASRQQQHTEMLAPAIDFVARAAGVHLPDIDVIAVGLGPGLFTGLRVGVATARAMGQALGVPVVGVPSLDVVAHRVRVAERPVLVVMDARRSELFWACFRPRQAGGLDRCGPDQVDAPARVAEVAGDFAPDALVVGDGPQRYPAAFSGLPPSRVITGQATLPSASTLVELAAERLTTVDAPDFRRGGPRAAGSDPSGEEQARELYFGDEVRPLYVRAPDAEAHWVERSGVVGRPR